ncbi:UNVERIFIED_CONTAM: putative membrane protein [Sesamum angustifolium]|uniref:Membrane protein n=1 Tax=Sesamum angustifolium TaxID=2727405 RepID=A0AAW2KX81_9LAMI
MEVPVGFVPKFWSFVSFLPFFFLLFILGLLKGLIICPVALVIIAIGNSAVVVGLWPAHFLWTYYCVAKSKRLGWILKILALFSLPVPLILWPVIAIIGSVLGGIGYGFFAPLIATFEAVGENVTDKWFHCFSDGCCSTLKGSCTAVRDFTDFCFHSYFSFMDELSEEVHEDEKPIDIKLSKLPACVFVSLLAIPVDVPFITGIALWKSPYMLFRGWKRLLEDLVGREGPFLETVCVPFAGLAIILWPLAVIGAVLAAFLSSFFLGLYAGLIVYQLILLTARPQYRRNMRPSSGLEKRRSLDIKNDREGSWSSKLVSQGSRTLKQAIQQYTPMQVWDWLFKSCEVDGKTLVQEGLINVKDIQDCIVKGDCKKLGIKLPAWSILQCLLRSAKSGSSGLIISCENNRPEDWDDAGFPSSDKVRRAQLQADKLKDFSSSAVLETLGDIYCLKLINKYDESCLLLNRLQGIVGSMSRLPTFRRRFKNLVKVLYVEAIQTGLLDKHIAGSSKSGRHLFGRGRKHRDAAAEDHDQSINDVGVMV